MIKDSTNIQICTQLGRLCVYLPLKVELQETGNGWLALLTPSHMTTDEWGEGPTVEQAVEDLASTVWEIREQLLTMADDTLGADLLAYKQALRRYTAVNTTAGTVLSVAGTI